MVTCLLKLACHIVLCISVVDLILYIDCDTVTFDSLINFYVNIGLTETCAGTFVSLPNEMSMLGTVGPPVPNVDVCLKSVPEMEYDALSSTPRGEVCVRGGTVFSGYYKREDLTKEVMVDGWFHTGCPHFSVLK